MQLQSSSHFKPLDKLRNRKLAARGKAKVGRPLLDSVHGPDRDKTISPRAGLRFESENTILIFGRNVERDNLDDQMIKQKNYHATVTDIRNAYYIGSDVLLTRSKSKTAVPSNPNPR